MNPWLVLVLVCMAQFMVILDATIVNVALPSIQADLDMSDADLQWIVNAYTLVFGGFLLLGGRAGDLVGRKRIFLVGVVIFTVASLLNGLAPSSEVLIVCRGLQGLGAALVAPAALSIITTTFAEGPERAKAMSVWAAIAVGGGAVGLVVGGILVEALSWPWIFFVNIPVGIAVFVAALRYVPESKDERAHKAFDLAGAVTVTAGLIVLVYAIVEAQEKGWISAHTFDRGRDRARAARGVRLHRAPLGRAAGAAEHLPRADRARRERGDVLRRRGPLRDVLLQHALPPARARLLARWRPASRSCPSPRGSSSAPVSRRVSWRR